MERLRVVFDCNIFWRAVFSFEGAGAKCVTLIKNGSVLHFMSRETLAEMKDVLTRPAGLEKFTAVSLDDIELFIASIVERSTMVRKVPRSFNFPRDPKDEPYIELAGFVDADHLVTTDRDLLDLMSGSDIDSKQFRQKFRKLKIVRPEGFLRIVSETSLSLIP